LNFKLTIRAIAFLRLFLDERCDPLRGRHAEVVSNGLEP